MRLEHDFDGIIGASSALKRVFDAVETVAPTDATVLIRGETGTGKEMLARAIHNLSPRHNRTMVRLNVAALPVTLIESELFGYEKGAFTGAVTSRTGRLELANHGTLFLDEVGDMPLEVQPKLLRVLQEREFERLGSTRTQRVDVRLIAATNRNLEAMVTDGLFRRDLLLPPERLPSPRSSPPRTSRRHPRARAVFRQQVLTPIRPPCHGDSGNYDGRVAQCDMVGQHPRARTLDRALGDSVYGCRAEGATVGTRACRFRPHARAGCPGTTSAGRTAGDSRRIEGNGRGRQRSGGAAAKLGVKRTTLQSKMRKLGILRPPF